MENMKEYPLLYELQDLNKNRDLPLFIDSGTWNNSELSFSIQSSGFGEIPSFSPASTLAHIASGTRKNSEPSLPVQALGIRKILSQSPFTYTLDRFYDFEKFRSLSLRKPEGKTKNTKDTKHDLYYLVWLINIFPLLASTNA